MGDSMPIIYGIWADDARLPYYGSTRDTLAKRKTAHQELYNKWKKGIKGKCSSFDLFDAVGFDACSFEVVERLPEDASKEDLLWRERWYIENCPCINKLIPIRTDDELKEYNTQYRKTHKNQRNQYQRQYRHINKEVECEKQRQYRARKKAERIEVFKALLKTDD